jgi:hypothetical protein
VGDGTPVISSISNTEWPVGATTSNVVISGEYFGTNPIVNFSDSAVTCTQTTQPSDSQITCDITVGVNTSGGEVDVTVTSQGYNGSGFIAMPNGGSHAGSNSKPANKQMPTFLKVVSTQQKTHCLDQECELDVWYQVLDYNGTPIHLAGQHIAEHVDVSSIPCNVSLTDRGTWDTDSTGTMPSNNPDLNWACFYPDVTGDCVVTGTQTFTVNGSSEQIINGPYVGSHNVITYQCTQGQSAGCPSIIPTP